MPELNVQWSVDAQRRAATITFKSDQAFTVTLEVAAVEGLLQDAIDGADLALGKLWLAMRCGERLAISEDHLLDHASGGDAGEVASADGGGEREAEADGVVRGIADDSLIEVADLDFYMAIGIGDRAEVADVAVAADPDGWAFGERVLRDGVEPLVELEGIAANVGVGGARHLAAPGFFEDAQTVFGRDSRGRFLHL